MFGVKPSWGYFSRKIAEPPDIPEAASRGAGGVRPPAPRRLIKRMHITGAAVGTAVRCRTPGTLVSGDQVTEPNSAPCRFAPLRLACLEVDAAQEASERFASCRFAFVRSAFLRDVLEVRSLQVRVLEECVTQVRAGEVGARQQRAREVVPAQMPAGEIRVPQVDLPAGRVERDRAAVALRKSNSPARSNGIPSALSAPSAPGRRSPGSPAAQLYSMKLMIEDWSLRLWST